MDFFPLTDALLDASPLGVVPIVIGPLQALLAVLPGLLVALGGALMTLFKPQTMKRLLQLLWAQKLPVLGAAAVIGGLIYLWPRVFPPSVAEGAAAGEWPAFRGGPLRQGVVTPGPDPVEGGINWSHTADKIYYGSPTVVGDKVYAISALYETFRDEGTIYCVDANTGKERWRHREPGFRATFSSPAIAGGGRYLVSGEGLHYTENARIFCFDISGKPKKLWSYETRSHVESSPVVADGRVYVGAGDDGYYCLALEPETSGVAEVLWHAPGPKSANAEGAPKLYADCESSPIVVDGRMYAGLGIGGQAVVCFDAVSGEELWRIDTPYPVFSAPTVMDGKLYVGMGVGDYVNSAEQLRALTQKRLQDEGKAAEEIEALTQHMVPAGEVWCIDLTGEAPSVASWKFPVGRTVLGAVAARDGRLYFGSRDGYFYSITAEGSLVARFNARRPIITSPALGQAHVYFMTEGGRIFGLDADSLAPVWELGLGQGALFMSSPALGNGHLYIGTDGNGLVSAGQPADEARERIWSGEGVGYGGGGLLPSSGRYAWRYPSGDGDAVPVIEAAASYLDGSVYVGMHYPGTSGLARVSFGVEADEGGRMTPTQSWFYATANPVVRSAAVSTRGEGFVVDGAPGMTDRALHALDLESGAALWTRPVASDAEGWVRLTGQDLFVGEAPGRMTCLVRGDGGVLPAVRWSVAMGAMPHAPLVRGDIVFAAGTLPPTLGAFDLESGTELWRAALPFAPQTAPLAFRFERTRPPDESAPDSEEAPEVRYGDVLVVGGPDGVAAVDLLDGRVAWTVACGAVQSVTACGETLLAALNASGELVFVDVAEGRELKRVPGADPARPPVFAGGSLLFGSGQAIERLDVSNLAQPPRRWLRTSWLGALTAPLVGGDSLIFFATDRRGLVCADASRR